MAKLVEGMTQAKSQYGFVHYFYKGVRIDKCHLGYELRREYIASETGRTHIRGFYSASQLKDTPSEINRYLADTDKYYVDSLGVIRLTESYKGEIRDSQITRSEERLAELRTLAERRLAEGDYKGLEVIAQRLVKENALLDMYKEQDVKVGA